jgi:hypothetical protein
VEPLAKDPLASPARRSPAKSSPSFEEAYRNALDGAVVTPEELEMHAPATAEYEEELISAPSPPTQPKENLAPIVSAAGRARPAGLKKRATMAPKASSPPAGSSSGVARPTDQPASFAGHYPATATPLGPTARQVAVKSKPTKEGVSTASAKLGLPEFEVTKVESATLELRKVDPEEETEAVVAKPSAAEKEQEKAQPETAERSRQTFAFPKKLLSAARKVEASSAIAEKPAELLVKPAFVVTGGEK